MKKIICLFTLMFFASMAISYSVAEQAQVLVFKIQDQEPVNSAAIKAVPPEYDPKGKLDPFKPWISENQFEPAPTHHQTDCIENQVLQSVDLSQLKLTGIILSKSGNKALFQEASGKGHVAYEDMCIGIHGGKVSGVRKDCVIVQEAMKDLNGRISVKETQLKLRR